MAVPAHDQRDLEFARKYGLAVRIVIVPEDHPLEAENLHEASTGPGRMQDSGPFTGLPSEEAKGKIVEWLVARGIGASAANFKLRDWLFSRQRYWGEPFPIVHCGSLKCSGGVGAVSVPLPEQRLPVELPEVPDFKPSAKELPLTSNIIVVERPLDRAKNPDGSRWKEKVWDKERGSSLSVTCPNCLEPAERETNTMPQWAGSCWYYLRYLDPHNDRRAWEPEHERYWMPVDLYIGGAEHAVLHLLYARFWHKVLYDLDLVSAPEPFKKLVNQGLILGEDGEKMSKSRGNVVNPDDVIDAHGADAFRLYEMFMGPLEAVKPWSTRSIEGVDRFLQRLWRLVVSAEGRVNPAIQEAAVEGELRTVLHRTIREVTEDIEHLRLNTAIAQLMVCLNRLVGEAVLPRQAVETFVLLVAPFAPHLAEELWQRLGHRESLAYVSWPRHDPHALEQAQITWVVQINGKVRARLTLPAETSDKHLKAAVLADAQVKRYVDGQPMKQFIVVPRKLVNIVV